MSARKRMYGRACAVCRNRKIRCDGERPCSRCVGKGTVDACLRSPEMFAFAAQKRRHINNFGLYNGADHHDASFLPKYVGTGGVVGDGHVSNTVLQSLNGTGVVSDAVSSTLTSDRDPIPSRGSIPHEAPSAFFSSVTTAGTRNNYGASNSVVVGPAVDSARAEAEWQEHVFTMQYQQFQEFQQFQRMQLQALMHERQAALASTGNGSRDSAQLVQAMWPPQSMPPHFGHFGPSPGLSSGAEFPWSASSSSRVAPVSIPSGQLPHVALPDVAANEVPVTSEQVIETARLVSDHDLGARLFPRTPCFGGEVTDFGATSPAGNLGVQPDRLPRVAASAHDEDRDSEVTQTRRTQRRDDGCENGETAKHPIAVSSDIPVKEEYDERKTSSAHNVAHNTQLQHDVRGGASQLLARPAAVRPEYFTDTALPATVLETNHVLCKYCGRPPF